MKKLQWLAVLMVIAILGITGFQFYWLKQNYEREKKALAIKTDFQFRETITHLQVSKLKLDGIEWKDQAGKPQLRVIVTDEDTEMMHLPRLRRKSEVISTINIIGTKMRDSQVSNTIKFTRRLPGNPGGKDYIFDLLYGVDSLQDSLKVVEISSAYTKRLKEQNLNIPFSIIRIDSVATTDEPTTNRVTIGFAKPITYQLQLGNCFPYLIRQMLQPILFSILLLGVTLLSFVLLYRALMKQQRLAELKNEFISNVTHELKTPIATVGVAIEALKNFNAMDDPKRTQEYLDISSNELQRLSLLVDKVLKLSMFEKKEIDLKYETVDLHALAQEVVASLKLQSEKNKASIHIMQNGETSLRGDRLHLLSVIFNLLDNALKYSKERASIAIDIKGHERSVVMKVTDNGIGIPQEYRDKVFEKFFRVPHGDTHNAKGYGLGLSYAAQVIHKHGGEITVDSQLGQGTTFIINLPK